MKAVISTSSFGVYDAGPLEELRRAGIDYELNPYGRKLKEDEVVEFARGAVGIIAGTEELGEEVLKQLPDLKIISRCGAGMDNVDIRYAENKGIIVFSTPYGPTKAVAELTIGLILDLLRKVTCMDRGLRNGTWKKQMGNLLAGRKIGIFGLGRIGSSVASLLKAFDTEIAYSDPVMTETSIPYMEKEELLSWGEIILLHCPSGERPLIGPDEFKLMRKGAWIVNTSRGGLIDEEALYKVLNNGTLSGAALDVFESEPYAGPLCDLDNVILTPHVGSYAKEGRIQMEIESVKNLIKGIKKL